VGAVGEGGQPHRVADEDLAAVERDEVALGEPVFYTKLNNRLLRPLLAADQPQAPPGLRQALATIDRHVSDYIAQARLGPPRET
jgi:hypothetical protein